MLNLILFILIANFGIILTNDSIEIVETHNGKLRGIVKENHIAFHSVPYAEPPVGENRYESPKPIKNWTGIHDATKMATECMQWNHFIFEGDRISGDEDCLYLNIYTPSINSIEPAPVVIFIHGGAFQYGTGNPFSGEALLKENIVYVTIAYRLGALGFLTTGDDEIPGNLGLKDQRLALHWIKNNIQFFGGDPEQITLTGFSAGGASVHFHLLDKNTENLIKAAVSFSGTVYCPWVFDNDPESKIQTVAALLNCTHDDTKELKKCLKTKPADQIARTLSHYQFAFYYPFRAFGPVLEPKTAKDPFIIDDPENIVKKGKNANIPWLMGFTSEDGGYNAADLMRTWTDGKEYIETFWKDFDKLAPIATFYGETLTPSETNEYTALIKKNYNLKDEDSNLEKYYKIQKIFTDELFVKGALKAIEVHKDYGHSPVYGYIYNNPSIKGTANWITGRDDINFGCVHGDDVFLMFTPPSKKATPLRKDEEQLSRQFVNLLKTFAKTGIPKLGEVDFPLNVKYEEIKLLRITNETLDITSCGSHGEL